jgi:hypothetical protein
LDTVEPSPTPLTVVRCLVAAHAAVRATPEMLVHWRRQPPPITGQALPASLVKHSEDQTLAALAAMHTAISECGWLGRSFADWGVIAAANFFGRGGNAHTIQRFGQEGAWGVSPHMIPHHSLHAVSGTISQLLKIHGPNFGISGAAQACQDAFLIAAAILAESQVPGLWVLLSGHERECVPVESAKTVEPARPLLCEAVALALVPAAAGEDGLYLRVGSDLNPARLADLTLASLVDAVSGAERGGGRKRRQWRLPGTGWVELEPVTQSVGSRR